MARVLIADQARATIPGSVMAVPILTIAVLASTTPRLVMAAGVLGTMVRAVGTTAAFERGSFQACAKRLVDRTYSCEATHCLGGDCGSRCLVDFVNSTEGTTVE